MRLIFWLIVALGFAVLIGVKLISDPSLMLLQIGGWQIELPFWLGIVAAVFSVGGFWLILRLIGWVIGLPDKIRKYFAKKRAQKSQKLYKQGMLALFSGEYQAAQRYLASGAKLTDNNLINYLSAAKCAANLGDILKRDEYLKLAYEKADDTNSKLTVGLLAASLQLENSQLEQALATTKNIIQQVPNHKYALELLQKIYYNLQDWYELLALLPALKKHGVLKGANLENLTYTVYRQLLLGKANHQTSEAIKEFWPTVPKDLQHNPDFAYIYANALNDYGDTDLAENIIRAQIKRKFDLGLVRLYGAIKHKEPHKAFAHAQSWLKDDPENPDLLITLGVLGIKSEYWGQAKEYLLRAIKLKPSYQAYAELAILMEKMNHPELASEYYKDGLLLLNR